MAADEEILITLKVDTTESAKSLKQLRQEYKDQLKELEGLTVGTKEYVNALSKIGAIKGEIGDLNDTIKAFNPDAKMKAFGSVASGMASGIQGAVGAMGLFGVKSEDTQKMLLKVQAATAFAEGINGIMGMGDAFDNLKKILLANPIMLIATIVIGIGTALFALKDKVKIIGDVFDFVGEIIGTVIQAFKDLTDFMGLTSFASDELAATQIANAKKTGDAIVDRYDREIARANAAGKNTLDLERKKQLAIIETLRIEGMAIVAAAKARGEFTDEDNKRFTELIALTQKAADEVVIIDIKKNKELQEKAEKATDNWKKEQDKKSAYLKSLADKALEQQKANDAKELENTKKLIDDLKKLKEDEELRLAATEEEKLSIQKERQIALLEEQYNLTNQSAEAYQALQDAKLAIDSKYMDDVNTLRLAEAQKLQEQKTAELQLKSTNATTEYEQLVAQGSLGLALSIDLAQQKADAELAVLKDKNERGLLNAQEYADAQAKVEEDLQAKKLNAVEGGLNSAQSLSNAFFSLAQASAGKDAKKQLELKKKQFKVDKAFNLVRATIDGIRSVQAALTQTPPLSYVLAAFNGVMAAANIAKIASSKFEGETGGGGGGSSDIPSAMTAPTINAPSSSSTQLNADGSVKPSGGQITSRVIVVESDITNKQRQVASMQQNASV
jgi:hypothetical protein